MVLTLFIANSLKGPKSIKCQLQKVRSRFASKITQRFAQKSAASNGKAVANVDGDLMSTAMQTEGQVGTVGMAEEAMQSGMKRLAADSAALQTSLSSVRDASAKVNADINEEFAGVPYR